MEWGMIYAFFGAAIAVGVAGIGSSLGIGYAGMASCGLLSEEPEKFGKSLILVALPGTQGFYGFISGIMILAKIAALLKLEAGVVSTSAGLMILAASLPVAVSGLFSGMYQGKVSASGIAVVAKKPDDFMKAVIMSALVETYAVLGLLATILILARITA